MFKLTNSLRTCTVFINLMRNAKLSSTHAAAKLEDGQKLGLDSEKLDSFQSSSKKEGNNYNSVVKSHSSLVAAAFASLKKKNIDIKTPFTDERISKATTVDELLSISQGSGISRKHAMKVVSMLSEWTTSQKINMSDYETDPRFLRICRVLMRSNFKTQKLTAKNEDLNTILNITAEDEAARLINDISLAQLVKITSTLAVKSRRSIMLLRALSYNITRSKETLNIKQCADLLYALSVLNFSDENVLARIMEDICIQLGNEIEKSAVIGSILTSLGLLRYRNPVLLDTLTIWVAKHQGICRPQDVFSLFKTLAVVNYLPSNAETQFELLLPLLTMSEAGKLTMWLDLMWSLVLLGQATNDHISTVLEDKFVQQVLENGNTGFISSKLKLLNVNAAAQYLQSNYSGPTLPSTSDIVNNTVVPKTKSKIELSDSIKDALKNLFTTDKIRTNVNTRLGFCIDAECILDSNCNPLDFDKEHSPCTRIAIMSLEYHDVCRGKTELTGINAFAKKVLEAQGYKVLHVPYTDFSARDKLVNRVRYLEQKLKELVKL